MQNEPMFPILNDPIIKAIPWAAISPHEKQAQRNHSQTLRGLAGRGGLDVFEAYFILKDRDWPRDFTRGPTIDASYRAALMIVIRDFERARAHAALSATEGQSDG